MSVSIAVQQPGSPKRISNWKERFQFSYISAIAAAAGCNIIGEPTVDEGIDLVLSHRSSSHKLHGAVYLELQLKATTRKLGPRSADLRTSMTPRRYAEFASTKPTMNRIVVVMGLPKVQQDWVEADHQELKLKHCSYWVNLYGAPPSVARQTTVRAPRTNIFDDVALSAMMNRIGQGGRP